MTDSAHGFPVDGAEAASGAQTEPALAQNETTEDERLDGVVVQTRADLGGQDAATIEQALRSRLNDAGISMDDDEIAALARDLAG
ncbi:hypothetical protein [Microbacterium sp. TNHR37B]|uniref:hypothetical protein n=1 Tax=Microbacterium sp. TNHR37B TaxID=1775956 RepID=UPI0007B2080B|nr:hypothetical protein [Microbacterium sp. TNHR37B]KZE88712.1 hypothetical protein AVP41_03219 [Microbacterium sp. TNHR37B]